MLHLKIKRVGLVLEERVHSMKTQEQGHTLYALPPIHHPGILQFPVFVGLESCSVKVSEQRGAPQHSLRQCLCPSTYLYAADRRNFSDLKKQTLKAV